MKRHYAEEATELQLGEVLVTLRSSARCWQIYRVRACVCVFCVCAFVCIFNVRMCFFSLSHVYLCVSVIRGSGQVCSQWPRTLCGSKMLTCGGRVALRTHARTLAHTPAHRAPHRAPSVPALPRPTQPGLRCLACQPTLPRWQGPLAIAIIPPQLLPATCLPPTQPSPSSTPKSDLCLPGVFLGVYRSRRLTCCLIRSRLCHAREPWVLFIMRLMVTVK